MGFRLYFLEEKNVNSKTIYEVSRYSDLYPYLSENVSHGSYDKEPELVLEADLINTEKEVREDLERAKFRLIVNMAQGKDAVELQENFEYYEELFRVLVELEVIQKMFYQNDEKIYCWIG